MSFDDDFDEHVSPSESMVKLFNTALFGIDFTQPISTVPYISNIAVPNALAQLGPSLASNKSLLNQFDLFKHTTNVSSSLPSQSTTFNPSISYVTTPSYTNDFLNMVGNSTQFADHLRNTLLLSVSARNFVRTKALNYMPDEARRLFVKSWSNIISPLLTHFDVLCKHYNIAACGSFNLSNLLHYFFNQIPSSITINLTPNNTIFSFNKSTIAFNRFNNAEQIFLSTTLPTAFRASPMHSDIDGGVIFPLSIPSDQSDAFTQHYTKLLDTPTETSINNISPGQVPISRIPFSVFIYLGLINTIMDDLLSLFSWVISKYNTPDPRPGEFSINITALLSYPLLPDNLWCRTFLFVSKLARIDLDLVKKSCGNMNLVQIMSSKLHSIIRFPICLQNPLTSFVTYSSQSVLNAMLQTMSSILAHHYSKSSSTNPVLHQQGTYFGLQIMYIYLIMQSFYTSENDLPSFHAPNLPFIEKKAEIINFSFKNCLELFQNIFYSQKNKPTIIINKPNSVTTTHTELPLFSPHLFSMVASLIIRFGQPPQPFLASIAQLLLDNQVLASTLYSRPQFSHLTSCIASVDWKLMHRWKRRSFNSKKYDSIKASMFAFRLVSTPFLQSLNLNQAFEYYSQQSSLVLEKNSDTILFDIINSKISTHTTSSAIIDAILEENPTQNNQKKLFNDQLCTTLTGLASQIFSQEFVALSSFEDIVAGLQVCQDTVSQGGTISPADLLIHSSTVLTVSPIINVIPYMAARHNFNKTLYHYIVCHQWDDTGSNQKSINLSFQPFAGIFLYLELYHTFLCKPIVTSTMDEISAISGPPFEINLRSYGLLDINDVSRQLSRFLRPNPSEKNNININPSLSFARIMQDNFNVTDLSKHFCFQSNLHKHAHLPKIVVLPLYYSYTEALVSTIMGFSYTQFQHSKDNNPIESAFDPITNQLSIKIINTKDKYIESVYERNSVASSLSHGTIFQISEECQLNDEKRQCDETKCEHITDAPINSKDSYSEHILSLYNNPHHLTQLYVPPHRQSTYPVIVRPKRAPKHCLGDQTIEQMPLTFEWSSAMVQHSIELFIDLLLHERSYDFISQIDFSDDNPLARQSEATLNYFDKHITGALSDVIAQGKSSSSGTNSLPPVSSSSPSPSPAAPLQSSRPMGNLPYFYNLTEQQQVALYETYSYDALFGASYGPFDDVPLIHAPPEGTVKLSEEDLSDVLTDVNTIIPNWLDKLLSTQSDDSTTSHPTQDVGLRFDSL